MCPPIFKNILVRLDSGCSPFQAYMSHWRNTVLEHTPIGLISFVYSQCVRRQDSVVHSYDKKNLLSFLILTTVFGLHWPGIDTSKGARGSLRIGIIFNKLLYLKPLSGEQHNTWEDQHTEAHITPGRPVLASVLCPVISGEQEGSKEVKTMHNAPWPGWHLSRSPTATIGKWLVGYSFLVMILKCLAKDRDIL